MWKYFVTWILSTTSYQADLTLDQFGRDSLRSDRLILVTTIDTMRIQFDERDKAIHFYNAVRKESSRFAPHQSIYQAKLDSMYIKK